MKDLANKRLKNGAGERIRAAGRLIMNQIKKHIKTKKIDIKKAPMKGAF